MGNTSPSSSSSDNDFDNFNILNQKRFSIGEIKRNHKKKKNKTKTENKFGFVVSEKDSRDYEVYFSQKQERKRFSKMKIFEDFIFSDERRKEDKSEENQTRSDQLDSTKRRKKRENSLRIVLPLCNQ